MQVEAWLTRAARTAPTVTALQAPDAQLSYAELERAARAGALELAERGARAGERVAIALPPGAAFAQALHACFLLGAVAVPVDLRLTPSERERIAASASVLVDGPLTVGAEGEAQALARDAPHDLAAVCAVIHTSGTTSDPRPIELTYGNFLWSAIGSGVALGVDPNERWLCALPLSHVGGLSILIRSAIYSTTAVIHERFETERALAAIQGERITLVSLVSTTLARLLDAGLSNPPWLRCALTGGGPVPAALVQRARDAGVPMIETYGLTECCSQAATTPLVALEAMQGERATGARTHVAQGATSRATAAGPSQDLGAGVPLFCTRTEIAPDGEILLSGPTVARGVKAADGRLHTGDLGRVDERGFLHVTGRKADTIVSGGENVAPNEVEAVLESCPGVLEAAVLGRPDEQWGEAVSAIVVAAPEATLSERVVREHCAAQLAPFKVPKHVTFASEPLPRTASGKLLRRELQWDLVMSTVQPEEGRDKQAAREHRTASLAHWEEAASGWVARQATMRELSAPVSHWMIDAVDPQPGQRVLELAAGLGETGFLAAEMVAPVGGVITSDQADAMLDGARKRAGELNLTNVEFQVLNAEWIDLPVASVDVVFCRWGYMLMVDPLAALTETRRVLRPEGHVALAVWDAIEHNPWALLPGAELLERGLIEPPPEGAPGPFALGGKQRVRDLLEGAGFDEVWVERLNLTQRAANFDEFWETTLDIARVFHDAVLSRPESEIADIRDSLAKRFAPYTAEDGSLEIPMRTLVGVGTA
ncbi:MAG TPA: AMP-binding protein [Solirubrobacteraceae bacterium]|jgi:O-succinylbenzoic acid--CoA ligase|nr:AMP-binding protein [Solirubrobacteraceae bacterium]